MVSCSSHIINIVLDLGYVGEVCNGYPSELDGLLEGSGSRFRRLDHEMLVVEMPYLDRIRSPHARGERAGHADTSPGSRPSLRTMPD